MKKFSLFRPLSSSSIMAINVMVIVIVMVVMAAIAAKAFTGPSANPPTGTPDFSGVPSGAIMLFATSTCPSGWSEYTTARGRVVVITPSGGTDTGTVGTALTNLAERTIASVVAHTHAVDPPSTASGGRTADHTHFTALNMINDTNWSAGSPGYLYSGDDGLSGYGRTSGGASADHAHYTDIASFTSGSTGSASVDVTMPYIQLHACSKN